MESTKNSALSQICDESSQQYQENDDAWKVKKEIALVEWLGQEYVEILMEYCGVTCIQDIPKVWNDLSNSKTIDTTTKLQAITTRMKYKLTVATYSSLAPCQVPSSIGQT